MFRVEEGSSCALSAAPGRPAPGPPSRAASAAPRSAEVSPSPGSALDTPTELIPTLPFDPDSQVPFDLSHPIPTGCPLPRPVMGK